MYELNSETTKEFTKGLKYELMFRKLSRQVFEELEENPAGGMKSKSIALLNRIEAHNTVVMEPVRRDFGVSTHISCTDKLFANTVTVSLKVMPSIGFRYLEGSASRFVDQLEDIASLSPAKYEEEMRFMVEHERALHGYLVHFNQGRYIAADSIFEEFIERHQIN
ncbi:hypothetical protein [Vibrio superstes]|uniref:Uncharacterized protein n=1 Tax=Vibrio superstes NBRC 103154 TaxID=1219062 RepID=A0A511QVV7_9VIBR|nr:hypothetical protein [Vibrio superstes]GEM81508.1 hypothetical protein VSU01S_37530 [Vibrio superstes NBRC 103154]